MEKLVKKEWSGRYPWNIIRPGDGTGRKCGGNIYIYIYGIL
jgi:hypothetical protein